MRLREREISPRPPAAPASIEEIGSSERRRRVEGGATFMTACLHVHCLPPCSNSLSLNVAAADGRGQ